MFTPGKQIPGSGLTILLVEQQTHRAMQVASYAFVVEKGTTGLSGKTSGLVRHEHIKKVYLGTSFPPYPTESIQIFNQEEVLLCRRDTTEKSCGSI